MVAASTLENDLNLLRKIGGTIFAVAPIIAFADLHVVVIEGLGGEPKYAEQFGEQIAAIERASRSLTPPENIKVFRSDDASRDPILEYFEALGNQIEANDQLVVFLIGHGSYDDYEYKFNIPGPDLTGDDIADMLDELPSANQLLVNTSSASGAIFEKLQDDKRTLILATRSGAERHATRFGTFFAAALSDPGADTDKNQIITAQESFSFAERQVSDFFERNGQLRTEHARIEGLRADRFPLARLGAARTQSSDRELESLFADRDTLNAEIDQLRLSREDVPADDYDAELLQKMLELARIEDAIEVREQELDRAD